MSYCINPRCSHRENSDTSEYCQSCGTALVLDHRYRLLRPLRELDEWEPSEIFEVHDAKDMTEGRTKVLKVLKKPILLPLFEREVKTLQQLEHPGIPQVEADGYFSVDVVGRRPLYCLVMENIQGVNLDVWLQEHGPIGQTRAVDWMRQLADLLAQLHKEELFHRDIKLSNIMLRSTGQLALIDFGTVRPMTNTYFAKVASQRDITSVVSPGYTPLEQINGRAVPQSDFYALGRSFIYLLTGKHPIDLPDDEETGQLQWRDQVTQPIAEWFAQLIDDMTAPFPGQRPLNADVLLDRLTQQSRRPSTPSENQRLRLLVVANLCLLGVHLWMGWQWINARQRLNEQIPAAPLEQESKIRLLSPHG